MPESRNWEVKRALRKPEGLRNCVTAGIIGLVMSRVKELLKPLAEDGAQLTREQPPER